MNILFIFTTVAVSGLVLLVYGALVPRGQALPNAEKLELFIHAGLFPDKPKDMSFVEYFQNCTGHELDGNVTAALEKLEFGVLDFDNLETAIKLAEDTRRYKELANASARRQLRPYQYAPIFDMKTFPRAWDLHTREKLFQFMQHAVYSARYEINKLKIFRQKYRNSTVYRMGLRLGNNIELKTTAGQLYTTMARMHSQTSMLWYLFHYHKLLNIAYDVGDNTEFIFMMQERIDQGFLHYTANPPLPRHQDAFTAHDPEIQ